LGHKYYNFLIFVTGAAVLALELLASRVKTPYFGVSLYIWSAILATTLSFLAIGYYLGGLISGAVREDRLEIYFLWSPLVAAMSIAFACLVYPVLFPALGAIDLLMGSFVGSVILLGIPLICLAAMNPLLIAMERQDKQKGDVGAGRVFFISTAGSVAGVFITAFLLIPNMSNFRALLSISMLLIAAVVFCVFATNTLGRNLRIAMLTASLLGALFCTTLLAMKNLYFTGIAVQGGTPATARIAAEYHSLYGNTKVIEHTGKHGLPAQYLTLVQDGHVLNNTLPDGTSLDSYTYLLEALALKFSPRADRVLVLGLGAGIVPMRMSSRGSQVTVVELDPGIIRSAFEYFGFQDVGIDLIQEDARTFVRRCPHSYDVIIVDLFQGDGVPDYLMTAEFFADLRDCMEADGTLVMNTFFDNIRQEANLHVLATLAQAFPFIYQATWKEGDRESSGNPVINSYLVGRIRDTVSKDIPVIEIMPSLLRKYYEGTMSSLVKVPLESLEGIAAITDEHNFYSVEFARMQMAYRDRVLRTLPLNILVN